MTWDFPDRLEASAMVSVSILGAVACLAALSTALVLRDLRKNP